MTRDSHDSAQKPIEQTSTPHDDASQAPSNTLKVAMIASAMFTMLAALVALLVWTWFDAVGVIVGGTLAVVNLWAFQLLATRWLAPHSKTRTIWSLVAAFKFVALLLVVAVLLRYDVVGAIALLAGYCSLPFGITLAAVLTFGSLGSSNPGDSSTQD